VFLPCTDSCKCVFVAHRRYLDAIECDKETRVLLDSYLELIAARASGKLMTLAAFMRQYVVSHRAYQQDSRVPMATTCDLMHTLICIQKGLIDAPELLQQRSVVRERQSSSVQLQANPVNSDATTESKQPEGGGLPRKAAEEGCCTLGSPLQTLSADDPDYDPQSSSSAPLSTIPASEHPVRIYLQNREVDRHSLSESKYLIGDKTVVKPGNCQCELTLVVNKDAAEALDGNATHVESSQFISALHDLVSIEPQAQAKLKRSIE
jgi:hypothetical protein